MIILLKNKLLNNVSANLLRKKGPFIMNPSFTLSLQTSNLILHDLIFVLCKVK